MSSKRHGSNQKKRPALGQQFDSYRQIRQRPTDEDPAVTDVTQGISAISTTSGAQITEAAYHSQGSWPPPPPGADVTVRSSGGYGDNNPSYQSSQQPGYPSYQQSSQLPAYYAYEYELSSQLAEYSHQQSSQQPGYNSYRLPGYHSSQQSSQLPGHQSSANARLPVDNTTSGPPPMDPPSMGPPPTGPPPMGPPPMGPPSMGPPSMGPPPLGPPPLGPPPLGPPPLKDGRLMGMPNIEPLGNDILYLITLFNRGRPRDARTFCLQRLVKANVGPAGENHRWEELSGGGEVSGGEVSGPMEYFARPGVHTNHQKYGFPRSLGVILTSSRKAKVFFWEFGAHRWGHSLTPALENAYDELLRESDTNVLSSQISLQVLLGMRKNATGHPKTQVMNFLNPANLKKISLDEIDFHNENNLVTPLMDISNFGSEKDIQINLFPFLTSTNNEWGWRLTTQEPGRLFTHVQVETSWDEANMTRETRTVTAIHSFAIPARPSNRLL
ncbi:hypothetical protein BGW36DRAFT_365699 [Talaromyces proteolyticus]|uniref:Uncharacterized protein n=1 Tax=Talaromyces proteolyticus TaxID=1131652 RepID=A0AAD4KIF0_9EURO|nr:uncharacterized protein BGW36DRAFT_365699 [Talaromyces proteolyticus]KAH8689168.1 hypothetical protein BGW36DRAFT_365699 [Talaromyces proteolyticus]